MELERFINVTSVFVALIIAIFCSIQIQASMLYWTEFDFNGFDNIDCSLIQSDVRVKRFNRTTFAFSGTVNIKSEMSNDWEMEFNVFYSAKCNNQFVKLPYNVPKTDLCTFLDGPFTRYGVAKHLADSSDFPALQKGKSLCVLYTKGTYTVKDAMYGKENLVKFLHPGYYKGQIVHYRKNSNESSFYAAHLRLY